MNENREFETPLERNPISTSASVLINHEKPEIVSSTHLGQTDVNSKEIKVETSEISGPPDAINKNQNVQKKNDVQNESNVPKIKLKVHLPTGKKKWITFEKARSIKDLRGYYDYYF